MNEFLEFAEGKRYVIENGWPQTTWFLLSRKSIAQPPSGVDRGIWTELATISGDLAEIVGTGYERKSAPRPPIADVLVFETLRWETRGANDWSPDLRSVVAFTASALICAWDVLEEGRPRVMSAADTTYESTPVYRL